MRRFVLILFVFALAAGVASVIVVATVPNSYPTPSDSLWGRQMPGMQGGIDLALIAAAALLAGCAVFLRLGRLRLVTAAVVTVASGVGLYFASVIAWRLHAPASAGNF